MVMMLVVGFAATAFMAALASSPTLSSTCIPDPALPPRLLAHTNTQPLCSGYLDPTKAPYDASGDGRTDDTTALQTALDDAYAFRMVVWLPAGRVFLVSMQLRCVQSGNHTVAPYLRQYGCDFFSNENTYELVLQ